MDIIIYLKRQDKNAYEIRTIVNAFHVIIIIEIEIQKKEEKIKCEYNSRSNDRLCNIVAYNLIKT